MGIYNWLQLLLWHNVEELYKEQRMEKTISLLKKVIVFLIILFVLLCIVNHYYELCILNIRIRDFIIILFCICIIISAFLLFNKKSLRIKIILGFVVSAFLLMIGTMYDFNSVSTEDYTVFNDNNFSVVVRINKALSSNVMAVYLKTNPYIMKRANINIDFVLPPDYNPIKAGDYQVKKEGSTLIIKIKINKEMDEYREYLIYI